MFIADAHCDTISRILDTDEGLYQNSGHLDVVRMQQANVKLQFFAAWIDPKYLPNGFKRVCDIINKFNVECAENTDYIARVSTPNDMQEGKINAVLTVEGGSALDGNIDNLQRLWDMSVRCMTLTWNGRNELADGVGDADEGLTDFGRKVVCDMAEMGMIIDISHIAERGFWDVFEEVNVPVFATHSNAKKICDHPRNLTDEQITAIIRNNGFIGINFYPDFLGGNIDAILRHTEHILELGGENALGFGADFDGVDKLPEGITGAESYGAVIEKLLGMYSEDVVRKIAGENLERIVMEIGRTKWKR